METKWCACGCIEDEHMFNADGSVTCSECNGTPNAPDCDLINFVKQSKEN